MNRLARVAVLVGVLLFTAVAGLAISGEALARDNKQSAEAFRADMRMLWEDHIVWTRQFIVSAATLPDGNLDDLAPTAERLLRNQDDIGNAIAAPAPFAAHRRDDLQQTL